MRSIIRISPKFYHTYELCIFRSTRGQLHRPQCKMQAANRSSHYAIKVNQLEKDKEELQAKVQELSKMNKLLQQQQ